jgi:hypothetical protein
LAASETTLLLYATYFNTRMHDAVVALTCGLMDDYSIIYPAPCFKIDGSTLFATFILSAELINYYLPI